MKAYRQVDLDRQECRPISELAIAPSGTIAHLKGLGSVRVFKVVNVVSRGGDIKFWATNDQAMDESTRLSHAERSREVENYHRGLKQCCGVERA